jgi:DNA-binding NarL/FixJ family response regulator
MTATRVAIADDSGIFRDGLAMLLAAGGIEVVASCPDVPSLLTAVRTGQPDACVVDVRMPPSHTDEGIRAAVTIRAEHPGVGVLVLSTYTEPEWAEQLLADGSGGVGYLLKDRVHDGAELIDALARVSSGGTAVDPEIVSVLLRRRTGSSELDSLTPRELQVLSHMAQGRSNRGISRAMYLAPKTVEAHVAAVFTKLALHADGDEQNNRRVLAVLTYLRNS